MKPEKLEKYIDNLWDAFNDVTSEYDEIAKSLSRNDCTLQSTAFLLGNMKNTLINLSNRIRDFSDEEESSQDDQEVETKDKILDKIREYIKTPEFESRLNDFLNKVHVVKDISWMNPMSVPDYGDKMHQENIEYYQELLNQRVREDVERMRNSSSQPDVEDK